MDSPTVHCVVYTGLSLCESWTVQQFIVLFTLVSLCLYHGQSNSSLCCLHWSLFVCIMDTSTVHCVVYTGLSLCVSWTVQQFIVLFTLVSLCVYHGQFNSSLCCLHWSLFVCIMDSPTVHCVVHGQFNSSLSCLHWSLFVRTMDSPTVRCVVYTGLSLCVSWTVQQFIVLFTLVSLCAYHGQFYSSLCCLHGSLFVRIMDSPTVHCVVYLGLSLCVSWTIQQFIVLFTLVSLCVYHGQSNSALCCLHWSLFVCIMDSPTVHCVVYTGLSLSVSWTVQQFIVLFTLVSLCLYRGQFNSSLCCLHWSLFVCIMDSPTVHCVVYTGLSLCESWTVQQFIVLFTLVSLCLYHGQFNSSLCCLHWSLFVCIMDSPTVHCVVYTGLSLCVSWTVQQFIVLFTLVSLCVYHGQSNSSLCCLHWSLFVCIMDSPTVHCVVYTGLSLCVSWTVQQFIVLFTLVSLCLYHGQFNSSLCCLHWSLFVCIMDSSTVHCVVYTGLSLCVSWTVQQFIVLFTLVSLCVNHGQFNSSLCCLHWSLFVCIMDSSTVHCVVYTGLSLSVSWTVQQFIVLFTLVSLCAYHGQSNSSSCCLHWSLFVCIMDSPTVHCVVYIGLSLCVSWTVQQFIVLFTLVSLCVNHGQFNSSLCCLHWSLFVRIMDSPTVHCVVYLGLSLCASWTVQQFIVLFT